MKRIFEDNRPIKALSFPDKSRLQVGLGDSIIDKIEPCQETGDMAYVTWFAIWSNDKIIQRVNAAHVLAVFYD